MRSLLADPRDEGIATVLRWFAAHRRPGDVLLTLGPAGLVNPDELPVYDVGADPPGLAGASEAVTAQPTERIVERAARSGLALRLVGEPAGAAAPVDDLGAGPTDALARHAGGRATVWDRSGRIAAALADGGPVEAIPCGLPYGHVPTVHGACEALRDNLRALGSSAVTVAAHPRADGEPIDVLVMDPSAEYTETLRTARVLGARVSEATAIVRRRGSRGSALALAELSRTRGWPEPEPLEPLEPSRDTRGLARKAGKETIATNNFLSGRHIEAFVSRHGGRLGGRVLDVGCGNKPYAAALSCETLVGVDVEQSSSGCVDVLINPGARLPFADRTFDGALCTEVLEHVESPARLLADVARVLRPGAWIVVTTPFAWPLHEEPRDLGRITVHGLRRLLGATGYVVAEVASSGGLREALGQLEATLTPGDDDAGRARIRQLNEDALVADALHRHPALTTHVMALARVA